MSTLMMESILEQPAAFQRLLDAGFDGEAVAAEFARRRIQKVWLVGSGTSYYAAMIAARSWEEELGIDCEAASALEFLGEIRARGVTPATMVVAVSQSGASLILLEGIQQANAGGAMTAVITAHPDALIPQEAQFVVEAHTGPEQNIGKTKGFTTTAFASVLLGRRLAMSAQANADKTLIERYAGLPQTLQAVIDETCAVVDGWVEKFRNADAIFVVGAGTQVPTAHEGSLKVLEVAKMPVIARELEEMMHGPFNGVSEATGIILAADGLARESRLLSFLEGVKLIGTEFVGIAGTSDLPGGPFDLTLPPIDDPAVRAIVAVVPFQILAHDLASARNAPIDTARYPQLYPVFLSKSIHK